MGLPGAAFDVRPAVMGTGIDEEQAAAVRELVGAHALDGEDEALLLAVLGLEVS